MSEKKLSRRDFLRISTLASAGTVLASCIPKTEEPQLGAPVERPPTGEGKLIQFWAGWGNEALDASFKTITESDEFKEAIGDNTFEYRLDIGQENVLTALAAGTPPDAASNIDYLDYMARDVALPIDNLIEGSSLNKDAFIGGSWEMGLYKGKMYGIPAFESFVRYGLNYNTRMFEAAGVDTQNLPETWDEWLEVHKELTKFDNGNLTQIGLDPNDAMGEEIMAADGWLVATSYGLKWFDEDAGTFNLNSPETIEFLETAKKFVDVIGVENLDGMRSVAGQDTWGGSYNAEVQAMIIEGYWHPGETAAEAPDVAAVNRATWIPVPENRRGAKVQGTGGHIIMFFKDAGNPEGMLKAAEVFTSKSSVQTIYDNLGWIGPIKDFSPDVSKYPGLDFYFNSVNEATDWYSPAKCPITGYINDQWLELREYVLRGNMSPKEAAAELQRRAEEEWASAGLK